ncbi:MAG: site-2 protease family protein [Bacteroidota bacterium]
MNVLGMILQMAAALSLLVCVHELGHLAAARFFGMPVKRLYIFFDVYKLALFRFRRGGTEFGMGWLPLGGYAQLDGHVYDRKPWWQRVIVMLGGPLANIVLAFFLFTVIGLQFGDSYVPDLSAVLPVWDEAVTISPDEELALKEDSFLFGEDMLSTRLLEGHTIATIVRTKAGQRLHLHIAVSPQVLQQLTTRKLTNFFSLSLGFWVDSVITNVDTAAKHYEPGRSALHLNGQAVSNYEDFLIKLKEAGPGRLILSLIHDGKRYELPAHLEKDGHLGFLLASDHILFNPHRPDAQGWLLSASNTMIAQLKNNLSGLQQVFTGRIRPDRAFVGPIRLATLFGDGFDAGRFWWLTALLSVALACINLLPLPVADGGRIVILTIEGIGGRKLPAGLQAGLEWLGLLLIIILSVFVAYQDIRSLL